MLLLVGGALAALAVTATTPKTQPHASRDTHDVLPIVVTPRRDSGLIEVYFSWEAGGKQPSLARSLKVFSQFPRPGDSLPAFERLVFSLLGSANGPEPDRARRLLAAGGISIYAEPTKQGSVCYFLTPTGGGSCAPALRHGALPHVTGGQVWGLMDDGATAVDNRVPRSGWLHATTGRNAFYLRLPGTILAPSEIVVRERSGIRHFYRIKRCHIGQISPLAAITPLSPAPCWAK